MARVTLAGATASSSLRAPGMRFSATPASSEFAGKNVLIMGLGLHGGGTGAAAFFARAGARVTVTDLKSRREVAPSLAPLSRFGGIVYHLGGHSMEDFRNADYIIRNPGVRDDSKFLNVAKK